MKFKIISYFILFFFAMNSGTAQMLNFLNGKKKKDSHFNYSTYSPKKDKKAQREDRKKINEQLARSYRPSRKQALSKEERKELNNNKKRILRSRGDTKAHSKKMAKRNDKSKQRYLSKADKKRAKQIAYNKKNYGTKATRKASQTHRSERNIVNSDGSRKLLFQFRRSS